MEELHRCCIKYVAQFGELIRYCADSMKNLGILEFVNLPKIFENVETTLMKQEEIKN